VGHELPVGQVVYKRTVMEDKAGVDPKVLNDVELIDLVRETWEEIDAHGEWNELNVLLHDFAAELVKRRVLSRAQLVGLMELSRARVEKSSNRQTQDADTRYKFQM